MRCVSTSLSKGCSLHKKCIKDVKKNTKAALVRAGKVLIYNKRTYFISIFQYRTVQSPNFSPSQFPTFSAMLQRNNNQHK